MATLIEWNGKETEIHPKNPQRGFTREELTELTGGIPSDLLALRRPSDGRRRAREARDPPTPREPQGDKALFRGDREFRMGDRR